MLSLSYNTKKSLLHKSLNGQMAPPNAPYTLDGQEWQARENLVQFPAELEEDPMKKLESWNSMLRSDVCWVLQMARRSGRMGACV